jgi:transposase
MSASQVFDVHYNTVKGWVKKYQETGDCMPRARVSTSRRKLDLEALRQDVQSAPSSFQSERASRFGVTQSMISKALAKMGITRKKKRPTTRNKMRNKSRLFKTSYRG